MEKPKKPEKELLVFWDGKDERAEHRYNTDAVVEYISQALDYIEERMPGSKSLGDTYPRTMLNEEITGRKRGKI